ncbi:MAG: putative histidine kinase, classic [Ramlibacter sp.]|jgi:PAS domain S-box-containing protein|nr:putative histidine kinase, classic [Ramlibacter sp.]
MPEPSIDPPSLDLLTRYVRQAKEHAIICLDPAGIITAWLGAAERIFGHTAPEAVGQPVALIFTAEDTVRGFDRYERVLADVQSRSEDDRWHVRKDGTRIWVTGTLEAVKGDAGELLGYVKVIRDRTDLRAQVERLENQVQSLGSASTTARLFLSTLGHELRNPLGPLHTAAHIVQRLSTDPRTDKAVQVMISQVGVLARLTEDLMDVSRVQAGKIELDLTPVDLRTVLNETAYALRPSAADKGVRLECVLPEGPLPVNLDVLRFPRVVLNLVGNAIKYTPRGGTVWIKATQEGDEVLLRVEDTGIGIAPEVLPRIFDLFTQERQAKDMAPGGLGIGLTIVKELVELHGGNVQARSPGAGKGAEFTVRLPVRSE